MTQAQCIEWVNQLLFSAPLIGESEILNLNNMD